MDVALTGDADLLPHVLNGTDATMQAFAETPDLDLIFIMNDTADKFQNALRNPHVTAYFDAREKGKIETFEISRMSVQGIASEVPRDSAEWERLKLD